MKIILEENDSFIQPDGQATMIVVAVTKEDGKVVRFPYSANKSMAALIDDINVKIGKAILSERIEDFVITTNTNPKEIQKQLQDISSGKIQKEDLVKCVKLLPRDKDAPIDMEIGGIYRVLSLPNNKFPWYEVIDDTDYHKAEIPRRVQAMPEEVVFFQKRKSPTQKEMGHFEEIFPCPICKKNIVCNRMDDQKYHGKCGDCNHEIISETVRQPAHG